MESRFAHDFSRVQVHADNRAAESARAVNALAYTIGKDVVFGTNQYSPNDGEGRKLLAHELTHVIQQESAVNINLERNPIAESSMEREAEEIAFHLPDNARLFPSIHAPNTQILRVSTSNCSDNNSDQIKNDASAAIPAIRSTMCKIIADPKSDRARVALFTYFGFSARPRAIWNRLNVIADSLPGSTMDCMNPGDLFYPICCKNERYIACTRTLAAYLGFGAIKLCQPTYHSFDDCFRIGTLVHEGSHRYVQTQDPAYYNRDCSENTKTLFMSDDDRYNNADSYGCLVQTLGCGGNNLQARNLLVQRTKIYL